MSDDDYDYEAIERQEKTEKQREAKNKCPHGHKFGADAEETPDCDKCTVIQECVDCAGTPGFWKKTCHHNPLNHDCSECADLKHCQKYQTYYSQIPHHIVDDLLWRLSGSEWKVFTFLNRRANWKPGNNYGRCYLTYEQIHDATRVSVKHMREYMRELKKHGLITFSWKRTKTPNSFTTIHHIFVTWRKRRDDLQRFT
jgi:hypothetical protein